MADLDRKDAPQITQVVGRGESNIVDTTVIEGENCLNVRPCETDDEKQDEDTVTIKILCKLQNVIEELKKLNFQLSLITDVSDD